MIVAIVGPTGVGKTKLSIELAKEYNAIIVNNDAMQVYKDMNIGTAKPSIDERENIKHELLDFVDVEKNYTVYDYQTDARNILDNYKGNIIFVGGTGLYLKAALYDYEFNEETNNTDYSALSNEELYNMALQKDKNMNIHINNRQRLERFLNKSKIDNNNGNKLLYDTIFIGLTTDRDNLYKRIDDRVDKMINDGLIEEVKTFYDKKINSKAINTAIGYKELYKYFDNEISLDEAIDLIKKRSRHYAKRQYTWFNNQMNIKWFDTNYDDFSKTIKEVKDYIKNQTN